MQTVNLSSTSGLITLLDPSEDDLLKGFALKKLEGLVDQFWPEISDSITVIEELHERTDFASRHLAALVASKVFYHLGAFPDAMFYALRAEELFDTNEKSEFVDSMVVKCIDEYMRLRILQSKEMENPPEIDQRLTNIVERMFDLSFQEGEFKHAIGIALQCRRIDKLEEAIRESGDMQSLLQYSFRMVMDSVTIDFRPRVLEALVRLYGELQVPDSINMCRCLVFLEDAEGISKVLLSLIQMGGDDVLLAYQMAFELCDNASQQLLRRIRGIVDDGQELVDESVETMPLNAQLPPPKDEYQLNLKKLRCILTNGPTIELYLQFLYRNNHADLNILKRIKSSFEPRNSILHTATIASNALMHSGTTRDTFLRDNLDWVKRATNWAKFSMTAGLGVIHKGHLKEACNVLAPYLPKVSESSLSVYTEGGSLYALGIIHANHSDSNHFNRAILAYLLQELRSTSELSVLSHGAALGLGVAAMGSGNEEIFGELLDLLYSRDDAIAGEAAGYALGLVMLGSAHSRAVELLILARETQHEKVIRGLVIGLALIYYGKEEQADSMIGHLIGDKDALLRYGGAFMIGLAYGGTGSNAAIKMLLHLAVSDVNDDVRRAAVMNIGFVLFRQPEQVPRFVSLLAESYNPAVRYGVCLAVGVACAGTGQKEAYELLLPLARSDPVDTVRQGALIALSMLLIQMNDSRTQDFRKHLRERIEDKHEPTMCKYGAILACGILDAGGRNVTISLRTRTGYRNMQAIVGLTMFLQYWYWYPLVYFISLAFTPTAMIALNKDFQMLKLSFRGNMPPFHFAYPAEIKLETKTKALKMAKVELSAAKRGKSKRKGSNTNESSMDVDFDISSITTSDNLEESPASKSTNDAPVESKPIIDDSVITVMNDIQSRISDESNINTTITNHDDLSLSNNNDVISSNHSISTTTSPQSEKSDLGFEILTNPARVTRNQIKYVTFDIGERYKPICDGAYGIVIMKDYQPDLEEEIINSGFPNPSDEGTEPNPPEPFEFLNKS